MSPEIGRNDAGSCPNADRNPEVGPDMIAAGIFARLAAEWDGFAVELEELLDAADKVVALGR